MAVRSARLRRRVVLVLLTLGTTALSLSSGGISAASVRSGWRILPNPHFGSLHGVSGISTTEVWAVGYFYDQPQGRYLPLAEHWDGRHLTYVRAPTGRQGYNAFNAVATLSSTDAWAVGYQTPRYYSYVTFPLIEHWNGTSWSVVASPFQGEGELTGVAAVSANDVWAVGFRSANPYGSLVLHWNGARWSVVSDGHPSDNTFLRGVVANGPDDVWAGGSTPDANYDPRGFAEHWDGSSWTDLIAPPGEGVEYEEFNAIAGDPSDGDLWGVGWESPGLGYFQMAQRYDGTSWQRTDPPDFPNNNNLYGVAVAGSSAWAVGYGSPSGRLGPLIERWNGQAWVIEENPGDIGTLYAITRIGRTLWAVGDGTVMVRALGGASD